MGCGAKHSAPAPDAVLKLSLTGPRHDLRPGEALVVTAKLSNPGKEPLGVSQLNAESVTFLVWNEDSPAPLARRAVASSKEGMDAQTELMPQTFQERPFVLLKGTEEAGTWFAQARYASSGADDSSFTIFSPPLEYRVVGERALERDATGLLTRDEAVRLASARLAQPVSADFARLVRNEAGLLDWWVTLETTTEPEANSAPAAHGFFINPYLGLVRSAAKPDPKRRDPAPPVTPARRPAQAPAAP